MSGLALLIAGIAAAALPAPPPSPALVVESRQVRRDGGRWTVDYWLVGPIAPVAGRGLSVAVAGDVSNARVPGHGRPLPSHLAARAIVRPPLTKGAAAWRLGGTVVGGGAPLDIRRALAAGADAPTCAEKLDVELVTWAPGHHRLRLVLSHEHDVYGRRDPLLGAREVAIDLAGARLVDRLRLAAGGAGRPAAIVLPDPPKERLDARVAADGRPTLHLAAHVPGQHYYRYPDLDVPYGTRMRLSFRYLIAAGTEGECRYRVAQYKDTPTSWRMLNDAGFEGCLKVVGRWTRVERSFATDAEATTLALDFRIVGDSDIGEMWVDDVQLAPAGAVARGGP